MAVFTHVYYWTYISRPELSVGDVLSNVMKLSDTQQVELFTKLGNLLVGEGLLPGKGTHKHTYAHTHTHTERERGRHA